MIDASSELRAARLRQIAAVEIARHREAQGFLGAALEGSLATGAVWPSSDADLTIVPRPEHSPEQLMGWERREALPFIKEHREERIHSLGSVLFWSIEYPDRMIEALPEKDVPGVTDLNRHASEVAGLATRIRTSLLDGLQSADHVGTCLAAAGRLLRLTEAHRWSSTHRRW